MVVKRIVNDIGTANVEETKVVCRTYIDMDFGRVATLTTGDLASKLVNVLKHL